MDYLLIPKILFRDEKLKKMKCKSKVVYAFLLTKFEKNKKIINLDKLQDEINTNDMTDKVILRCLEELKRFKIIDFSIVNNNLHIKSLVLFDLED